MPSPYTQQWFLWAFRKWISSRSCFLHYSILSYRRLKTHCFIFNFLVVIAYDSSLSAHQNAISSRLHTVCTRFDFAQVQRQPVLGDLQFHHRSILFRRHTTMVLEFGAAISEKHSWLSTAAANDRSQHTWPSGSSSWKGGYNCWYVQCITICFLRPCWS